MSSCVETLQINGVDYVKKSDVKLQPAKSMNGLEYCIVRTYSAGVFAGYVEHEREKEATVLNARRLWQWAGAASLSQLAVDGVAKPDGCRFPCEVSEVRLKDVIEVIPCTEKARLSIKDVEIWKA